MFKLIALSFGLVMSVVLLCYMLVSNVYEAKLRSMNSDVLIHDFVPAAAKPVEKEAKTPSLGWKPAHGVLVDDDYLSAGLEILEQTRGTLGDPELHDKLLSDAETACIVADNAIFRFMNNKDGTCNQHFNTWIQTAKAGRLR